QDSNALKNEADALKVLKEYDYEMRSWRVETFGDLAIATFIIRYRGRIRDLDFNILSRVTEVLIKHEDRWKILHEHWSRITS
ncbi:MAG: nuclear transport factor 2 family protein, partial [Candidatus Bathyarchaeia archaeon]